MKMFLLFVVGFVGFILAPALPLVGFVLGTLFAIGMFIRLISRAGEDW